MADLIGKPKMRPRARLMLLLGDELIRSPKIAVFELVKNSYDADASNVRVELTDLENQKKGIIIVEDDGSGMDWKTIIDIWLEPGADHRKTQRETGQRSPKYGRLPLGEKGVGRFAAHKLGRKIKIISRSKRKKEVVVDIDWKIFEQKRYLDDVEINVIERKAEHFVANRTGTRIEISDLREKWTPGMIKDLFRSIHAISSPFKKPTEFQTEVLVFPEDKTISELKTPSEYIELALFEGHCKIDGESLTYSYRFNPSKYITELSSREVTKEKSIILPDEIGAKSLDEFNIGPITIDLYIFDRDRELMRMLGPDRRGLSLLLTESGGVRVYRDGVRVYDYGERGTDWLGLDKRRINRPASRISNNLVLGAITLEGEKSQDLVEKTNREGFVESGAFHAFKEAVIFAITQIETERNTDKKKIRELYQKGEIKVPVIDEIAELRTKFKQRNLIRELGKYLDKLEKQYLEMRDSLLLAAGSGLGMIVVVHELEKGIKSLEQAVEREADIQTIQGIAYHLTDMVDGLTYLARKSKRTKQKASILVERAIQIINYRLEHHGITFLNGIEKGDDEDLFITCSRRLIIAVLVNLIDNSIYWLRTKEKTEKFIYIGTTRHLGGKPAIVVADSGPGFEDPPEILIEPFVGRKPDGMGLGLYLADEIMNREGGKLEFPPKEGLSLYDDVDKALIALVFEG